MKLDRMAIVRAARCAVLVGCAALASPSLASQQPQSEPERAAAGVREALDAWRTAHGGAWRSELDRETGYVRFLHGGNAEPEFAPAGDEEYFVLARNALEATRALHGVDADTLEEDSVMFLPLAAAGTTDKLTVQLRQRVAGVRVVHGYANVLFDTRGRLLSIDVTGLPLLSSFATAPAFDAERASALARGAFARDVALPVTREVAAELVVDQHRELGTRKPRLAWQVELFAEMADAPTEGFAYFVDALSGDVLRREARVHSCDVSGTVRSRATPGTGPDAAGNAPTNQAMPSINVAAGIVGQAVTDANGNFNFVGAFFPLTVDINYSGPYCNVTNQAGPSSSHHQTLTMASGNQIDLNFPATANRTAEANAFLWVNKLRNWIKGINGFDFAADFQAQANVNIAQTCNGFYDGVSINFYLAGGGCPNSAYSSVVAHEMGHWLNDRYLSGNGPDGFGEGNADVFAMYLLDTPIVGQDFNGAGMPIRTGLNTRQFCGELLNGCYGEVHDDGEVLMGALWKVRARLQATFGGASGGAIANTLFNAWMNSYNDSQIDAIIEQHWTALDDNDGNWTNGSPHFAQIDGGFRDQGFPGPTIYVDWANNSATHLGTFAYPYQYVADAPPVCIPGSIIAIWPGNYDESPMTINQLVTLRNATGSGTVVVR